jgi:hypothetical protein
MENKHERTAKKAVKRSFNFIAGGLINSAIDGHLTPEDAPTREDLITTIYQETVGRLSPTEIRFAGKDFIMTCIKELVENDPDLEQVYED